MSTLNEILDEFEENSGAPKSVKSRVESSPLLTYEFEIILSKSIRTIFLLLSIIKLFGLRSL